MKFRPLVLFTSLLGLGRPAPIPVVSADQFNNYLPNPTDEQVFHPRPDSRAFGQSATCARMRRHNRMRRAGIGGARI